MKKECELVHFRLRKVAVLNLNIALDLFRLAHRLRSRDSQSARWTSATPFHVAKKKLQIFCRYISKCMSPIFDDRFLVSL